jgi:hypothetical protein
LHESTESSPVVKSTEQESASRGQQRLSIISNEKLQESAIMPLVWLFSWQADVFGGQQRPLIKFKLSMQDSTVIWPLLLRAQFEVPKG